MYTTSRANITNYKILQELKGKELIGIKYEPLFSFFEKELRPKDCFAVIGANSKDSYKSRTGFNHCAPGFNQDDF